MKENLYLFVCEHRNCSDKATWRIRVHSWGVVTHTGMYCDKHMAEHISPYKLDPCKDIQRL